MPVYKYETKTGNKWMVRCSYVVEGEKLRYKKKGFPTKKEAQNHEYVFLLKKNDTSEKENILTFQELYFFYIEDMKKRIKETSIKTIQFSVNKHVLPYFSNCNIHEISTKDIRDWQNILLDKHFSERYIKKIHSQFSTILNYGIKYYNLQKNLLTIVGTPQYKQQETKKEMLIYSLEEFKAFSDVIHDITFKVFFELLYWTGMRQGEALALTWNDINMNEKTISITKTLAYVQGKKKFFTPPKNKSSVRKILLDDQLLAKLNHLKSEHLKITNYSDDFFVFGANAYLSTTTIQRKRDKYSTKANVKKIRIHDFRHSHASYLINNMKNDETNILLVAKRLGHSDIQMTLNRYSHLLPNKEYQLIDIINKNN